MLDMSRESDHSMSVDMVEIPKVRDRLRTTAEETKEKKERKKRLSTLAHLVGVDWYKERPHMSRDFSNDPSPLCQDVVPVESQEAAILDDLISCFLGFNGRYIVADPLNSKDQRAFSVCPSIDTKYAELAKRTLSMASHYSTVVRFIENNSSLAVGRVNQALSAAFNTVLHDYTQLVLHLESELHTLNLHSLWYKTQPIAHLLSVIAALAQKITDSACRGGQTLSVLHDFSLNLMNPSTEYDLCLFFMKCAAAPYMEAIHKWVISGIIYDPYDEFMVVGDTRFIGSKDSYSDEYWAKRYYLRTTYMPNFLSELAIPILDAGKYLNVVRECIGQNKSVDFTEIEPLEYSPCGSKYEKSIEKAYMFSSKYLLDNIIGDHKVIERIKTVKRFLLLQQGDFIVQLLDTCEEELSKPIPEILPSRLSTLVDMAVRIPSTNDDPYREDIYMSLKPHDLSFQIFKILSIMTKEEQDYQEPNKNTCSYGFEAFTLSLHCEWPVTLIMTSKILSAYQMLFRHLFHCKYIERLISKVWQFDKTAFAKKNIKYPWDQIHTIAYGLRHKMIFWIQNLLYYMTEEAIEPNWLEFLASIEKVKNVDEFLSLHWGFVKRVMDLCMLTNPVLLRIFQSLMSICKDFATLVIDTDFFSDPMRGEEYLESLSELCQSFQDKFITFLKTIGDLATGDIGDKFLNIFYRENFNHYFTDMMTLPNSPNGFGSP